MADLLMALPTNSLRLNAEGRSTSIMNIEPAVDVAFEEALAVCGVIADGLMQAITVMQGIADTETFISLTSKELDQLAIAINKMRPPEGQDPVVLNQIALKKLKAFRLWLLWRRRCSMDMDLTDFDADKLQWGLDRMAFEARFVDAEAPEQVIPEKLKSIGFDAIPIAYVFREHDEPTDEMILEVYADSDEE
jgi:hypothetical protein